MSEYTMPKNASGHVSEESEEDEELIENLNQSKISIPDYVSDFWSLIKILFINFKVYHAEKALYRIPIMGAHHLHLTCSSLNP